MSRFDDRARHRVATHDDPRGRGAQHHVTARACTVLSKRGSGAIDLGLRLRARRFRELLLVAGALDLLHGNGFELQQAFCALARMSREVDCSLTRVQLGDRLRLVGARGCGPGASEGDERLAAGDAVTQFHVDRTIRP